MSWSTELYVVSRKQDIGYRKSLELDEIKEFLEIRQYSKNYDEYIKPNILYFTEDLNELAKELNVNRVVPKGLYIMGIYGGEKKKGKELYAGIALHEYRYNDVKFEFRLWNTKDMLVAHKELLKEYGIEVYKVVYRGEINPFKLRRFVDVILSKRGECCLKLFLQEVLKINIDRIAHSETIKMIETLIKEVKQPDNIVTLSADRYYVAYRCARAFTAFTFKPQEPNIIIESHVAYVKCEKEDIAYYYAATLNYLAYKVIEAGRSFIRDQFARPLLAVYVAGLSWKDVDEATRSRVVELSKILHEKAPNREYGNQKVALKDIATRFSEFKELVKLLDSKVDRERLEDALNIVSGKGVEEEE
jgi:hypothetical protein